MTGVPGTIWEDFAFPYAGITDFNYRVDEIAPLTKNVAFTSTGEYTRTITYEGSNYSTIVSATILGGMENTQDNTRTDLVRTYLGFLLKLDGVFRGYVTDAKTGAPIQDATVEVGSYSGTTNEYGLCSIKVPPGTYEVDCEYSGYKPFHQTGISFKYNDTYWMDIQLTSNAVDDIEHKDRITRIYPNPCTSNSSVEFYIKSSSNVDIALYNILGQRVRTLAHDYFPAGYHEIYFEKAFDKKSKLSSGIYFMKLTSDMDTHVQKFLIVE